MSVLLRRYYQLLDDANRWLKYAAMNAIRGAFGQRDGMAVIAATNAYLNQLAASGQAGKDKTTALAGFINEDPMMVCSLGLEPKGVTMPIRIITPTNYSDRPIIDTGIPYYSSGVNYKIEHIAKWKNLGLNGWWANYYSYKDEQSCAFRFIRVEPTTDTLRIDWNSRAGGGSSFMIRTDLFQTLHTIQDEDSFTINGVYYAKSIQPAGYAVNGEVNFMLRFYSGNEKSLHKQWVNNELVRHMVPCKHNNVDGMLDLVNLVWRGPVEGSGTLTIPDIFYTPSTP